MPGIDGLNLALELLTVAAGMKRSANSVVLENRQFSDGIADLVVGLLQGFWTKKIVGCLCQQVIADI